MNSANLRSSLIRAAVATTVIYSSAPAASLYWDTNGDTAGSGNTSADWDAGTNWSTASTGDIPTVGWTDGETAVFSAGTDGSNFTATVTGTVVTPSIVIEEAGSTVTLEGGTITIGGGSINSAALGTPANKNVTIASTLAGAGGVSIASHGDQSPSGGGSNSNIDLTGTNTFTGDITLTSGLVAWNGDNAFGPLANPIILDGGGLVDIGRGLVLGHDLVVTSTGIYRVYGSVDSTLTGALSGAGTLTKTDGGGLIIESTGNTSFSGKINLAAGELRLADDTSIGSAPGALVPDAITISGGGRLQGGTSAGGGDLTLSANRGITMTGNGGFDSLSGSTTTVNSPIVGTGNLQKTGGGGLVLSGGATQSGELLVQGGSLDLESAAPNISTVRLTGTSTLNLLPGADLTTDRLVTSDAGSAQSTINQTGGTLNITGTNNANNTGASYFFGHWGAGGTTSAYNLSDGTINAPNAELSFGWDSAGVSMTQTGGIHDILGLKFGNTRNNTAVYNLNGGILKLGSSGIIPASNKSMNLGGGTIEATAAATWNTVFTTQSATTSVFDAAGFAIDIPGNIIGDGTINMIDTGGSGSFAFTTNGTQTIEAALGGDADLSKEGSGTMILSGSGGGSTSQLSVLEGTLQLDGNFDGSLLVSDTAVVAGAGSVGGNLQLGELGTGTLVRIPSGGGMDVAGNVELIGTTAVELISPLSGINPTAKVFGYGTLTGNPATQLSFPAGANFRSATFSNDVPNSEVLLTINNEDLTWTGSVDGTWDFNSSSNWLNGGPNTFFDQDLVTFDDTGSTTGITLVGELRPGSWMVDSNSNNYVFNGSAGNVIGGLTGLTKNGTSTLTINAPNTFTGDSVINAGTLVIGNSNALGAHRADRPVSQITIADGASVDLNGIGDATYGYTISGDGVGGLGAIVNNAGGIGNGLRQSVNLALAADASIGGTGNWALINNGYSATSIDLAGYTLTKQGSNDFFIANTTITSGTIQVDSGYFSVYTGSNGATANMAIADSAGAGLQLRQNFSLGSLSGGGTSGGNLRPFSGSPTLTLGANDQNASFAGSWTGNGNQHLNVVKTGTGTQTFAGTVTYPGTLTLSGGAVGLDGSADFSKGYAATTSAPNRALQGNASLESSGSVNIRRSSDGFSGTVSISDDVLTIGHPTAIGGGSVSLDGGTLSFDNSGSYFTVLAGQVLTSDADPGTTGDNLDFDVTTTDYGTMHNSGGDVVPGNTTHAYHGLVYLTAGDWSFAKRFDDGGSVTIDGTTIINNGTWNTTATGLFTAPSDGWYDIDVRVSQGGGGVGPSAGWTKGIGIAAGDLGGSTDQAAYARFEDGASGVRLVIENTPSFAQAINVSSPSNIDTSELVGTPGAPGQDGVDGSGQVDLTAGITGAADLTKIGAGTVRQAANSNGFTGQLHVAEGAFVIDANLRGCAGIEVGPSGVLITDATNMFVGGHGVPMPDNYGITVDGGSWIMTGSHEARFGNVTLTNGGTWTSNRGLGGYDALLANTTAGPATVTVSGSGTSLMNGSGGVHLQGVQNFAVEDTTGDGTADLVVDMILAPQGITGGAPGGVNKTGAGTMLLNAANTYTGTTTVADGTLGGSGSINSALTVDASATLAPGASTGTFTVNGDTTINGTLAVEIDGVSGDQLAVSGALDISGAGLDVSQIGSGATEPVYVIATYGSLVSSQFSTVTGVPAGYSIDYSYDDGSSSNNIALLQAPYNAWAASFPGFVDTAPGSNPDGDSLTNLLEFGFGTDPTVSDAVSLNPDGSVNGLPLPVASGGFGGVTFDFLFVRRDDHGTSGSVTYTPQFSSDLVTFYDSAAVPSFVADSSVDPAYEVVKVPYPATLPDGKKARFARMKVDEVAP